MLQDKRRWNFTAWSGRKCPWKKWYLSQDLNDARTSAGEGSWKGVAGKGNSICEALKETEDAMDQACVTRSPFGYSDGLGLRGGGQTLCGAPVVIQAEDNSSMDGMVTWGIRSGWK